MRKDQLEGGISKHRTVQTASNHAPKDTPAVQILNFSARNIALFGCLNCISFLMHLSNAIVALKQKTNKQTKTGIVKRMRASAGTSRSARQGGSSSCLRVSLRGLFAWRRFVPGNVKEAALASFTVLPVIRSESFGSDSSASGALARTRPLRQAARPPPSKPVPGAQTRSRYQATEFHLPIATISFSEYYRSYY